MTSDPPRSDHELDDRRDGRDETENERADRNWEELLQELRVMQTGTQILTGFLLAVAFQPRFTEMDEFQRDLYVVLVALAAIATILRWLPWECTALCSDTAANPSSCGSPPGSSGSI